MAAGREVERAAVEVGDAPAGFFDEQGAGGLIPDRLPILRINWNAHQQFGSAGCEQHLLRLAVHQHR